MYDEKICRYTLNRIFGYRPKIAHALVDSIGSASEVFRIGSTRLKEMLPYTKDICLLSDSEYEKSHIELKRLEAALLDGYNGVFQRLLVPAGQVRVGKVPVHPLIGDNAILFQLADNHVHIFGTGILSINQQCVFSFFHNNSHPSALVGFYTGLPCPPVFDIIILYPTFWEKASLSVVTLGTAVH